YCATRPSAAEPSAVACALTSLTKSGLRYGLAPVNGSATWPPVWPPVMVKVKVAEPVALVLSLAVTVTEDVPAAAGVPEISPAELIDSPAGRPVAVKVSVCPAAESVAEICLLNAVPTAPVCAPGLATVMVFPEAALTVKVKVADPVALVLSLAVTVTLELTAAVGVPEISPEELID